MPSLTNDCAPLRKQMDQPPKPDSDEPHAPTPNPRATHQTDESTSTEQDRTSAAIGVLPMIPTLRTFSPGFVTLTNGPALLTNVGSVHNSASGLRPTVDGNHRPQ